MKLAIILIVLAMLVGVGLVTVMQRSTDGVNTEVDSQDLDSNIETLQAAGSFEPGTEISLLAKRLEKEINARKVLEQKLQKLAQRVERLNQNTQNQSQVEVAETTNSYHESTAEQDWFNQQSLIDSGMNSSQVEELKLHFEQQELARLNIRDQSIREAWNREQYREAMQSVANADKALKERISEADYDAYLYAIGQANRVVVTDVLESSQAGIADIQSGDYILRYDNQPIYNGRELRVATTGGSIEDVVAIQITRDGEHIDLYLQRGPLGIRMNSLSVVPGGG